MGVCWTGTNKVNKDLTHFDTLEEEIKTYVTVVNKYGNGELKNWVTTIPETANQVDEFVKRVTYDKITSFNELRNNPALKEFVVNALNENMRTLVRASNEPASVIAEVGASQRLLAAAKFEDTILKTSTALHKFFRSLLRPFGLQDKIEPWVVRPNIIKLHPTAYNIYTKFFSLTNFADVAVKDFLHGSIKQLSKAVKADPVFQEHGINKEVFGRIFPVYDDQRRYAITNGNKEPQLFNNYLRQLLAENGVSNIDDNDLTAINVSFLRYKDMWNSINYGTIGEEHFGKNLMDMKPEDFGEQASLLRILYDIHKQYYELRDATSHTWTDNTKEVLERLHTSMANMKIRKGYIPGKLLNESDDIYASLSTQVKNQNLFNMVDYYFARDNTSYQEYEGDFFHILGNNVLGTSVLMQKLGLAGISDYLDYTLNRDTDSKAWFDGDPKRKEV